MRWRLFEEVAPNSMRWRQRCAYSKRWRLILTHPDTRGIIFGFSPPSPKLQAPARLGLAFAGRDVRPCVVSRSGAVDPLVCVNNIY